MTWPVVVAATEWVVVCFDTFGETVEATGPDPVALADEWAPAAQQEADKWPHHGLLYMIARRSDITTNTTEEK